MINNDKLHAGCGKGISRDMEPRNNGAFWRAGLAFQRVAAKIIFAKSSAYLGVAQ